MEYKQQIEKLPLADLYEIVCYFENEMRNDCRGFNIKSPDVKDFIAKNNISLDYDTRPIKEHSVENKVVFVDTKDSPCASLIYHLRNAFSHAQVEVCPDDTDSIIFRDYSDTIQRRKLNAYGLIKANLLVELIKTMRNSRTNDNK